MEMARNRLQLDERTVFSAGNVEIFEFSPLEESSFINNLGVAFIEISVRMLFQPMIISSLQSRGVRIPEYFFLQKS